MELSRTEYPSMLTSLQPTPAVTILRERLRRGQSLNTEVADWLQERRKVEELYVQGLLKLARKQPPGDQSELGIFRIAWDRIINSTSQLAASHQHFAQKIDTEVERPLREFAATNKDWAGLKAYEGNLTGIAKQIDNAEDKADKLRKKGARAQAARVAEAAAAVEKATGDWDSQAPFVFEKLQAVDETRCNNLRDSLTQYHTLEVDQAQRAMQLANESLSTLLDLNTIDEIRTFAETVTHGRPKIERQGARAPTTAAVGMPSTTQSIVTDDSVSVQSAGSGSGGGLRRLGTVLRGRANRNSTVPYMRSSSPVRSLERLPGKREGPPMTPASPRGSDFASTSSRNLSIPTPSSPSIHESARPTTPKANGVGISSSQENGVTPPSTADALQPPLMPTVSVTDEVRGMCNPSPQKDSEGYTIPPPVTDIGGISLQDNTWYQSNILQQSEQTQPQFKLEIKNDVIPEEEEEADAAMSKVASHLRMQNTVTRKNRGRRDARDVRNTVFFSAGTGPPDPLEVMSNPPALHPLVLGNSSPPMSPLKVPRAVPALPSEASDTQSIRSSRSVTSLTGGAIVRHPELHEPGLSSSIVESVNVSFDSGQPTRVTVVGEIALAYNPRETEALSPPTTQVVRMDNFSVLGRIAPNPTFISAVPEKAGEYTVSLAHLHRTTVAFRYQVHLEETVWPEYLPIIISPLWRMEPHQASVILNYKPNPNYHRRGAAGTPITLRNIRFITGIDGVIPASCPSKPVGTFARDFGRIAWKLSDMILDDESATGRLVARFIYDEGAGATAKHASSEMRWEILGDEATAAGSPLILSSLEKVEMKEEVDPFADEETLSKGAEGAGEKQEEWKKLAMVRKVTSGKYFGA
ncbi:Muniscin C-terminal mu homology domain-containing protein [Terfezia claveryi]|nr:Muniscin C-terminal mu homology domain-containing protein [Terfezia claveryi]